MMQLLAYGWKVQVKKAFCAGGEISLLCIMPMAAMPEEPGGEGGARSRGLFPRRNTASTI